MADYPHIVDADPTPPASILPPRVQPVAPAPTAKKAALLDRIARLKRQVVISSIVAFAVVLGFISGAWAGVGNWMTQQFVAPTNQQTNDGGNFFNQGSNSGGSNVGSSNGSSPSSGSRGS